MAKNKRIVSLAVNILILAYFLLFFYCNFETNDDYTMKMIVSGAYGYPDSHLIFVNSFIGFLLQFFYRLTDVVPWYELLQYILIFVSLSVITDILIKKNTGHYYCLLVYTVILISAHFLYVNLQFTKTTAVLTVCGYLLLDSSIENNSKKGRIYSILLLLIAMLFRRNQFLMMSFICVWLFIPLTFNSIKDVKNKNRVFKIRELLICGAICLLFFFISGEINKKSYSDSEWSSYRTYNSIRAGILDRGKVEYQTDPDFYDSIGLTEIDLKMMYELWNFDDPDVFSMETIKKISCHQKETKTAIIVLVRGLINDTITFFLRTRDGIVFTSLLVVLLIVSLGTVQSIDKGISIMLCIVAFAFCVVYTYCYRNNVFLERVHLSAVMVASVIVIYQLTPSRSDMKGIPLLFSILIITGFFSMIWLDDTRFVSSKKQRDDLKIPAIQEIKEDKDHIYVRTTDESLDYICGVFVDEDIYADDNIIALGGWMTKMPIREEVKKKYGIENPFRDIINNERAYLLVGAQDRLDLILEYIRTHYDSNVRTELVKTIEANRPYGVYRVISD